MTARSPWKLPCGALFAAKVMTLATLLLSGCLPISDADLARFATEYRDAWIQTEKPEHAEKLQSGIVQSIERTAEGWRVSFVTETGQEHPTGRHDYFLHVLIDRQGKLIRIVRGPDRLS